MTPHLLTSYPPSYLFCILGGCIALLVNGARLCSGLGKNTTVEVCGFAVGMVFGASLAADYVLRVWPSYKHIAEVLGEVGAISAILYALLLRSVMKKRRTAVAMTSEPAPSDNVCPPPPTSQSGTTS